MGCFLGCFGFSSKRKRRKPANKVLPGDPRHGSYEPLESSLVSSNLDIKENPITSDSQLSNKINERSSVKIGKKVSFNLNVQTYELLSNDGSIYHLSESEEEESKGEKNGAEMAKQSLSCVSQPDSTALKMGSLPTNYRYQNLADSYEDEDDMAYMESDLDNDEDDKEEDEEEDEDEDEDEDEGGIDIDDQRIIQNELLKQLNSGSMESERIISWIHSAEDISNNQMRLPASSEGELKSIELNKNARDRSQFVNSVLNPVENLTQWKAVKARAAQTKHLRKENIALQQEPSTSFDLKANSNLCPFSLAANCNQSKPLLQEVAIDASLSNWLESANSNMSKVTNNSNRTNPSKRSMLGISCSHQSREDRPILDITNLKA